MKFFVQLLSLCLVVGLFSFKSLECNLQKAAVPVTPSSGVAIRLTSDGHIAAWVKDDSKFPKTAFLLQVSGQPSLANSLNLQNAQVSFSGKCVNFKSKTTGQVIVFRLKGDICATPEGATVFEGWGIIKQSGDGINDLFVGVGGGQFPPVAEFSCKCRGTATNSSDCTSGGTGATECSTSSSVATVSTGCSVSCGSGYFACCVD